MRAGHFSNEQHHPLSRRRGGVRRPGRSGRGAICALPGGSVTTYPGYPGQTYPGYGQPGYGQSGYGQPGYGYNQGYGQNPVGQIIDQLLGNRYTVSDRTAISQCASAVMSQAQTQYRGYGAYGGNRGTAASTALPLRRCG